MMDYKAAAKDFIENEKQFQLGAIPTEQSNPLTRGLSSIIKKDTAEGVNHSEGGQVHSGGFRQLLCRARI